MKIPTTLLIMDGYGLNDSARGNAIAAAKTPVLDALFRDCPYTTLGASGMDVGLPDGQMGNSEVGHTNIGAGRVVYQELTRISKSIGDGDFFDNPALTGAVANAVKNGGAVHLMGLLSDGGVHSHNTHLYALLLMCKSMGARAYVHAILDGRDVSPTSGAGFVAEIAEKCAEIGVGQITTVMGRYYAMDREKRYERVLRAYEAMTLGQGSFNDDPAGAVRLSYDKGVTDEFVEPVVCVEGAGITSRDSVIFYNFRADRAREITRAFVDPAFDGFQRKGGCLRPCFVCMTNYDATMPNVSVAYAPDFIKNGFGEYISTLGLTQLRIAEYTKYAHVTFFFNGGTETVYPGEDRILIPSPDVETYDLRPEMSVYEVTATVCEKITSGEFDVIILNFANCDMVGHTGVMEAAIKAVEAVDACVGKVLKAMESIGGITVVTADHGNADQMIAADGGAFTEHTTNPVPFIIAGAKVKLEPGRLCDIAPTMLELMGLEQPEVMTGRSLIVKNYKTQ